jgi:hypothetical protein
MGWVESDGEEACCGKARQSRELGSDGKLPYLSDDIIAA